MVEAAEGRPLHVVTVYGFDAFQPGAPALNAELIGDILSAMAELGQAQWVVGGDWNEEADAIWEPGTGSSFCRGGREARPSARVRLVAGGSTSS